MKKKNPEATLFSTNCREIKENNITTYAASSRAMSEIDDVAYHRSFENVSFRSSNSLGDDEYIRGHLI